MGRRGGREENQSADLDLAGERRCPDPASSEGVKKCQKGKTVCRVRRKRRSETDVMGVRIYSHTLLHN